MIVKIQRSLFSSAGGGAMLIYNQDRSVMLQRPLTAQVSALLGDAPKGYFHVKVKGGSLKILGRAPDQSW